MNTNRAARFLLAALGASAFCGRGQLQGADDVVTIDNGVVSVRYDVKSGTFSARRWGVRADATPSHRVGAKQFLQRGTCHSFSTTKLA